MKAADAKNPKFDPVWWKANKSKLADITGKFEKLLKDYDAFRKQIAAGKSKGEIVPTSLDTAVKLLTAIGTEAAKPDPKLTPAQKETKEALATYVKKSRLAVQAITKLQRDPNLNASASDLVGRPNFEKLCKAAFVTEIYDFVAAVNAKKLDVDTYTSFIKPGAPNEINLPGDVQTKFVKAFEGDPTARSADWKKAWDAAAATAISDLTAVVDTYRAKVVAATLPALMP